MRRRLLWSMLILLVAASLGGAGCGRSAHNDSGDMLSGIDRAQLPDTSPGGNSFLLGSNLGCWGVNGDGSINEPFMTNTGQQNAAKAVIGMMRFPCRTFTNSQIISIVNKIKSQNIEPLVILPATDGNRAVQIATALNGIATYFEFGNENNWFNGWTGAQYASAWKTYVPQIRAAYPGIKIGGPVGSHFDATGSTYLRDFLTNIKGAGCDPDFISMHVYAEHGEDTSDQAVIDKAHTWGDGIEKMRSDCQSIVGYTFPFAITEWNWDAAPENTSDGRDDNATFMHNFNFAVLDEWKAHGVWMSCQYDFGAGAGGGKLDMYNKPQYTAFVDWKNANPPGGGTDPPGGFSLSSPANGATGVATNPTLGWGASSGAASYTLVVDDNSNYASPVFNQDIGNVTAKQVTGLANSTTYYWKVTAHNAAGDTAASNNSFSFTTAAAPVLPSGTSMEAESMALTNYLVNTNAAASGGSLIKLSGSGVTGTAAYSFSGSTGTYDIKVFYFDENDGACTYKLYVGGAVVDQWTANQNLGSADPVAQTRTSRTKTGVSVTSGAEIRIECVQNSQEWGRVDNTQVTAVIPPQPPGSFSLSSPANGATGVATNPTLSWGASSGAAGYTLVVDDNSNYASPVFNQDVGNVTSKQVTGLANSTTYYWKVTAHNAAGDTAASNNSFSFTTVSGPTLPSGVSMEAESMALTNYTVNTNAAASGGSLIKLSGSGVTGTAAYSFSGSTGTYDIKVFYFDENDGACTYKLYVGGAVVDQWTATQNLGSADPVAQTRTSRTKTGVSITSGAEIRIEVVQNSQEWGRVDNTQVTAGGPPPTGQVIPAESGTLAGGATVSSSANAENGQYVGYMHLSGASDTVSGVDGGSGGSKTLTIRYATSDTNPTLDLYVNGMFIRTLTFTKTNGWETFGSTSTSITLNAGTGNTIMLKHNSTNTGGVNLDTLRVQ